jgi:hypothetical protein
MTKPANDEHFAFAMNHNAALSATPMPLKLGSPDAIKSLRSNKLIVAKFQVPLVPGVDVVLGYDEKRHLNVQVSQRNCAQHVQLADTIRRRYSPCYHMSLAASALVRLA